MKPGDVVVLRAFDEVPEHHFLIHEVYDDCVTGVALTGPLAGDYGEPELSMILGVVDEPEGPQGTLKP